MKKGVLGVAVAVAAAAVAGGLGGCQRHAHVGASQREVVVWRIEGNWLSPQGQDLAVARNAGGEGYVASINLMTDGGVQQRVYPLRMLRVENATIAELQLVRSDERGRPVAGLLYGQVEFEGDAMVFRALDKGWLAGYAAGTNSAMRTVELTLPGQSPGVLASSDSAGMGSMLRAAARDPGAWGPGEVYTRKK
jgi:hypothetical protein